MSNHILIFISVMIGCLIWLIIAVFWNKFVDIINRRSNKLTKAELLEQKAQTIFNKLRNKGNGK